MSNAKQMEQTNIAGEDTANKTLTEENFRSVVLENSEPVLVDFWADWCKPCHAMAPIIEELARDFAGHATVGKLNVDEFPALAADYAIRSIPTTLVFKDGEVVDRVVGTVPKHVLAEKLQMCTRAA